MLDDAPLSEKPPHVSAFSTEMLPSQGRLDIFMEEFARQVARLDFAIPEPERFHADFRSMSLGALACHTVEFMPAFASRTPDLLKGDGNDDFVLVVNCGAEFYEEPSGEVIAPDAAVLKDNTMTGSINLRQPGAMMCISIPRAVLMRAHPGAEDLAGRVGQGSAELHLIRTYVRTMLAAPQAAAETMRTAGDHILDLAVLTLGARGDAAIAAAAGGKRSAQAMAIRSSIIARLSDPALSLPRIARTHGISERYVQQLLARSGTSFSEFVIEQRLQRAYRLLTSPAQRSRRIADIAFEVGFGDVSHFNRMFRRRFGDTPGSFRTTGRG